MAETNARWTVAFRYWAGARAAAGTEYEVVEAATLRQALEVVTTRRDDPRFAAVLAASSLLSQGIVVHEPDWDRPLDGPLDVEILPPFAGGSGGPRIR